MALASALPRVMPRAIARLEASDGVLVTFDDGPDPVSTPILLDILERESLSAMHFHLGSRVLRDAALVRACVERGDAVGCHGHVHERMTGRAATIEADLTAAIAALRDAVGKPPLYFRPPYGWWNPLHTRVLDRLGLRLMLWNRMPGDFLDGFSAASFERALHADLRAGDIIVLHDQQRLVAQNREILPLLARVLHEKGLRSLGADALAEVAP